MIQHFKQFHLTTVSLILRLSGHGMERKMVDNLSKVRCEFCFYIVFLRENYTILANITE